jgi:hypothetical protein
MVGLKYHLRIRKCPRRASVFHRQTRAGSDSFGMKVTKTGPGLCFFGVRGALLVGVLLVIFSSAGWGSERQWVSFERTFSELGVSESQVVVNLVRHGGAVGIHAPLSVPVRMRYSVEGFGGGLQNVEFGAGDAKGACTVRLPQPGPSGADLEVYLEVLESAEAQSFGRPRHLIRRRGAVVVAGAPVINAVVFSGAETPVDAVEGRSARAYVGGGIVALGGAALPPGKYPAHLAPKAEYTSGEWVPPLSPYTLCIQFGAWKSHKAP